MIETSLRDLAHAFDLFLVDQFGVLHDGSHPYPGAVEALRRLRGSGRRVVILSNSGKRSAPNEARMARLGFDPSSWDLFLSSGELAWSMLSEWPERRRCLVLSRDGDLSVIDGLPVEPVASPDDADLVLIAGSEAPERTLDDYAQLLAGPASRRVQALCVNPDMTMLTPRGLAFAPGRIARLYADLGGPVAYLGKPFPEIYRAARARFPEARKAVAVGDSIEHDIVGGKRAGLATALVRTGIHADLDEDALAEECTAHGVQPDFVLERFAW